jgi:hypothetical protein
MNKSHHAFVILCHISLHCLVIEKMKINILHENLKRKQNVLQKPNYSGQNVSCRGKHIQDVTCNGFSFPSTNNKPF